MAPRKIVVFERAPQAPRHDVAPRKIVLFERASQAPRHDVAPRKIRFSEEAPREIVVSGAFFNIYANLLEMN